MMVALAKVVKVAEPSQFAFSIVKLRFKCTAK